MQDQQAAEVELIELEQADEKTQRAYWLREIDASLEHFSRWRKMGKAVEQRYRAQESEEAAQLDFVQGSDRQVKGFNILYSNTETMRGAIYANPPKPVVERRFPGDDKIAQIACEVLERALVFTADDQDLHAVMKEGRMDYLLPGRFGARVFYEIDTDEELDGFDGEDAGNKSTGVANPKTAAIAGAKAMQEQVQPPQILDQRVAFARTPIDDYLESVDKGWKTTRWTGYRSLMSRKALIKRFGKEKALKTQLSTSLLPKDDKNENEIERGLEMISATWKRAVVWEIWDKARRMVWWVSEGYEGILDCIDDPLGLRNFFPSPKPAMAVASNETKVPLPLFWLYQDQAAEVDRLTQRIYSIVDAIRANGLFAGEHKDELRKLFTANNELIGIEDFQALMDKGGLAKLIEWLPIREMSEVVRTLYEAREQAKAELFEISGMADIIRGASDPRETLGAQKIKGQFATIRLEDHQENMVRMAHDLLELAAEIICEHYEPETLARITNIKLPRNKEELQIEALRLEVTTMQQMQAAMQDPQAMQQDPAAMQQQIEQAQAQLQEQISEIMAQPTWDDVIGILRSDELRRYVVRVETDSTIKVDQERERQERIEAIRAAAEVISVFGPMVQAGAMPFDLFKGLVLFLVRGMPGAREIEAMLDEWKTPPSPPQEAPDASPEVAAMQEDAATQREAMKLQANSAEAERTRQFQAVEAEKDRKMQLLSETLKAADGIRKNAEQRRASQMKMRQGNGA